jgi:hypothetical protein
MTDKDKDLSELSDEELEARASISRARVVDDVSRLRSHLEPAHLRSVAMDSFEAAKSEVVTEAKELAADLTERPIHTTMRFVKGLTATRPDTPSTALALRDPAWTLGRRASPMFQRFFRAIGRHPGIATFVGLAAGLGVLAFITRKSNRRRSPVRAPARPLSEPPRLTSTDPLHA